VVKPEELWALVDDVREALANAWDAGSRAGFASYERGEPLEANPYRGRYSAQVVLELLSGDEE
jgi:hypothetical protein